VLAGKLADRLSPSEMGSGIAVANRNARRLLGDAILLYESGRYPSATALAILAMEESAKWWTLLQAAVAHDAKAIRDVWRAYRTHEPKLDRAISVVVAAYEKSGGLGPTASTIDIARVTQTTKERCVYSDFVIGRRWIEPSAACGPTECKNHLSVALIMATRYRVTGRKLGEVFRRIAVNLAKPEEESSKREVISWSQGAEAIALEAEDDAECDSLCASARGLLGDS
jgi:AbiV family abortive infection protein